MCFKLSQPYLKVYLLLLANFIFLYFRHRIIISIRFLFRLLSCLIQVARITCHYLLYPVGKIAEKIDEYQRLNFQMIWK